MTEEKLDELAQQFGSGKDALAELSEEDEEGLEEDDELPALRPRTSGSTAREELERRLAEARARRRAVGDYEEPLA
jgi:DNA-binding IclR family transcriptional regulator